MFCIVICQVPVQYQLMMRSSSFLMSHRHSRHRRLDRWKWRRRSSSRTGKDRRWSTTLNRCSAGLWIQQRRCSDRKDCISL